MRRTQRCPQCGGLCSLEEVQGLCPGCLRAMLSRIEAAEPRRQPKNEKTGPSPAFVTDSKRLIMKVSLPLLTVLAMIAASLRAQVVNDGATNTLNNATNTFTGDVTVGTNGSFTLLVLSNNALLTNSVNGLIGRNNTANSNEVRLISPSARWFMGGSLFVGNNGAANGLVVSNGATVLAGSSGTIGYGGDFTGNANSNTVTVSGAGSLWSNGLELVVGELGFANRLEVNNGGRVLNSNGFVGRSLFSPSNTVVVTGAGSLWSNRADLSLGGSGNGNLLVISNGGWVVNSNASVGASSLGNLAVVTGLNSTWSNRADLNVGNGARGNQLVVSDGALVAGNNGVLGKSATSSNNVVLVTGGGSIWSNRSELTVGSFGRNNQLIVSNGGWVANQYGYLGRQAGSNFALVTGNGSVWSNQFDMYVGFNEHSNRLVIEAGGVVSCDSGYVGGFSSASNNEVLVTGPASRWTNRSSLTIGGQARGNRLVVGNGALVWSGMGTVGNVSNQVIVTGADSMWSNQGSLFVGGGSNRVDVSNGGWLACNDGYVGSGFGANSNTVVLTGSGSGWNNLGGLIVGEAGNGNVLLASNGATVLSSNATIGVNGSTANNNSVLLTGAGTLWSNRNELVLGNFSSGNQLIASNGAKVVIHGNFIVGQNSTAASNSVTLADAGTSLTIAPGQVAQPIFYLGKSASANRLVVRNGAVLKTLATLVGALGLTSNAVVSISDPGSLWTNTFELFLGGLANRLVVSNGAALHSSSLTLGWDYLADAVITGSGTTVALGNYLILGGNLVGGSRLTIENGAVLKSDDCEIGQGNFGHDNLMLVTGSGTIFTNSSLFHLSDSSGNNSFIVSNGAAVYTGDATMGITGYVSAVSEAIVDGPGSFWTNRSSFIVGGGGSRQRLVVTNGGSVFSGGGFIVGGQISSSNNRVVVDGNLLATNAAGTGTLDIRRGTNVFNAGRIEVDQLLVTNTQGFFEFNGGTLITRGAVISNNTTMLVGTNAAAPAVWEMRGGTNNHVLSVDLYLGSSSSFNQLLITNGALLTNTSPISIGILTTANSNTLTVSGIGSRCALGTVVNIGSGGSFNRLVVTNGGSMLTRAISQMAISPESSNNLAVVTGPGSVWTNLGDVFIGQFGSGNQLSVSDGGLVVNSNAYLGLLNVSSNNVAVVTGAGSAWRNLESLDVGENGPRNQLLITNGALVTVGKSLMVGVANTSTNNRVVVDGTLLATNGTATGLLEIRRGTNVLNGGLVEADILRMTNGSGGRLEINGGKLSVKSSRVSNGPPLLVGDGISPATFNLAGNGTHDFSGTLGLIVRSNATLTGNGSLVVQLQVQPGGQLAPGASVGKISLSTSPTFSGVIAMELVKNGASVTNDQIQVTGTVTYGGALVVTNLGPTALVPGDTFKLFNATAYAGSFTSLSLPPLSPPLEWKNKLLADGSIEVSAPPAILMSSGNYTQDFASLAMSGGVEWRDNSTLLGWYAAETLPPTNITAYVASDGSSATGELYSFGSTGSSERALGSIASIGGTGDISYGLCLTNDSANTLSNFTISYTGEQWRCSGTAAARTLTFSYKTSASAITNSEPGVVTNWTEVATLDFTSPTVFIPTTALDGNASTNRQVFSQVLVPGLVVPAGQNVFLRWRYPASSPHGLAVDDLTISFSVLAPRFTSIFSTNGVAQLTGIGESNVTYAIEAASNLNSPIFWQRIGSNSANGAGVFQFTDTNAAGFPVRFYRALFP
jgi:T5SS/PEP-CTERM-associated repeat protein